MSRGSRDWHRHSPCGPPAGHITEATAAAYSEPGLCRVPAPHTSLLRRSDTSLEKHRGLAVAVHFS